MIILGWLVLLVISIWLWVVTLVGSYVSAGFSGKVGAEMLVPLAFAILFSWLTYDNWPFVLAVKVATL